MVKHGPHLATNTFKHLLILRILDTMDSVEVLKECSIVTAGGWLRDHALAWQDGRASVSGDMA
jgi:hypothetical protein